MAREQMEWRRRLRRSPSLETRQIEIPHRQVLSSLKAALKRRSQDRLCAMGSLIRIVAAGKIMSALTCG